MKSFRDLALIGSFLLLTCLACQSRKDPFEKLHQQLDRDEHTLSELQQKYPEPIRDNFQWCDSMLQFVPKENVGAYFEILNLAQAYLTQFNLTLPVMQHDLAYIRNQLSLLQQDLETHFISDSLAQVYLQDETASADTLHYRVCYFQDRLSTQDKALKTLRKNISKDLKR